MTKFKIYTTDGKTETIKTQHKNLHKFMKTYIDDRQGFCFFKNKAIRIDNITKIKEEKKNE